jgi:hypothetical protein
MCLVPVNSFCERADTKPRKTPTWFALDASRPLFAFAGIWTTWRGVRGPKSVELWDRLVRMQGIGRLAQQAACFRRSSLHQDLSPAVGKGE